MPLIYIPDFNLLTHHLGTRNNVTTRTTIINLNQSRVRYPAYHTYSLTWKRTHIRRIPRIIRLERPRNRHGRRRRGAPAARDLDLGAADVELRRRAGVVDPQLLDAEEVLAVGDALWDVGCVRV
jgi:hypothetical protein